MGLACVMSDCQIKKELFLDFKGNQSFSQATHQSTISQGVGITITKPNKPSSEIKRGEAQSQSQMQITNTQYRETDVKTLVKDVLKNAKQAKKFIDDAKTFVEDNKKAFGVKK